MEIKTKAKQWGSSLGFILPKSVVDARKIRENEEIVIEIKSQPVLDHLFGKFPRTSGRSAQGLKNEAREGWN